MFLLFGKRGLIPVVITPLENICYSLLSNWPDLLMCKPTDTHVEGVSYRSKRF